MKKIFIYGATSAIASACARLWAQRGYEFVLCARNHERLKLVAEDLRIRGASSASTIISDANQIQTLKETVAFAIKTLGQIDIVLIAHGELPDQLMIENDGQAVEHSLNLNAVSTIVLLTEVASVLEKQESGNIGVITSVAGDRGRRSNYLYGSSKAAVSTYCEGLRVRLSRNNVILTDIRPGLIATPMTQGRPMPKMLVSRSEAIALRITEGIVKGKAVVYAPAYWKWVMLGVKLLPRFIMKKIGF
jgi:decaprenylphospho-beta-D-erythro-pentofuranosid-2-ulose 2-reductase